MRIQSINTKKVYDIELRKGGENAMPCPECSADRKHPKSKSFSFNASINAGYCQNCLSRFVEYREKQPEKEYTRPEWKNITSLSDAAVKYFTGRGISQETLNKMRVYSDRQYIPAHEKECECICFPYFRDGELVNIKFRGPQKSFSVVKGAELVFYNYEIISTVNEIVIVEGEIDLLSCVECGITNVISVPNGAANTEYLDNCIDLFDGKTIIICVDNDAAGITLRNELIRRFGAEHCSTVNLCEYKDANEYLQNCGGHELHNRIKEALPVPVAGIVDLNAMRQECFSMFQDGIKPGLSNGVREMDEVVTWETGRLCIVTGIPKHGKSAWVDDQISRMNVLYGWKTAIFSPENYPSKVHIRKMIQILGGKSCEPRYLTEAEFWEIYGFIENNYFWIYPEDNFTIDTLLQKAQYLVKRKGIKQLVLDPWNRIEAQRPSGISETEYTGKVLDKIDNFGKRNDILTYVVAHTTKLPKMENGAYIMPGLYDINGSANFYNKCDYGVIVYRDFNKGITTVNVAAVKFDHCGAGGQLNFVFNYINKRFEVVQDVNMWSKNSWLNGGIIPVKQSIKETELQPNTNFYEAEKDIFDGKPIETGDEPF
jgi:twinkle protein